MTWRKHTFAKAAVRHSDVSSKWICTGHAIFLLLEEFQCLPVTLNKMEVTLHANDLGF